MIMSLTQKNMADSSICPPRCLPIHTQISTLLLLLLYTSSASSKIHNFEVSTRPEYRISMATIKYISSVHSPFQEIFTARERIVGTKIRISAKGTKLKKANLCARKRERIKIPNYEANGNGIYNYHISEFLNQPSGVEALLNTSALQSFQSIDSNLYRCILPQVQLLNFEVAPVIDLHVIPSSQDCVVEMLSCKFEGSDVVRRQNQHFSASMRNHIKWDAVGSETFLEVDVRLDLVLEIYTQPFVLLPTSAVEGPGNIMIQAVVDKLVPLLLQQLLQDYEKWAHQLRLQSPS